MSVRSLFLGALLISSQVSAQLVIEQRDIPVQAGTIFTYYSSSDPINGIEVDPGIEGADRRWDLSEYIFNETSSDTLIDPEEAPERESFPDANRVMVSPTNELGLNIGGGYQYEAVTDSGWFMLGAQSIDAGGFNIPIVFPNPLEILPIPAHFEDSWEVAVRYEYGIPAPDTLMGGILDSVFVRLVIGGFSEIDGYGTVIYSGGEVPALRQHISVGGTVTAVGTRVIFGQRIEIELPFGYDIQTTQTYRWLTPSMGEIARITSMMGEADPDFNLASSVRVRRVIPDLAFPDAPVAFGVVHVGNSGIAQFRIRNSGEGIGSISRVEFSGGLESEIEIINALPMVIENDSSAVVRLLWSPTTEKSLWSQTVSFFHNDPAQDNPFVFALQGATPDYASVEQDDYSLPQEVTLRPVWPNPFNSTTTISFSLGKSGMTHISLRDLNGRLIRNIADGVLGRGEHQIALEGGDMSSGVYLVSLESGGRQSITSAVFMK